MIQVQRGHVPVSHPDEIIDQAAKALGKLPHDQPWPGFISKQTIERQLNLARRVADARLLIDPELSAQRDALQDRIAEIRQLLYAYVSTEPFPNVQARNPEMAFLDALRDLVTPHRPGVDL